MKSNIGIIRDTLLVMRIQAKSVHAVPSLTLDKNSKLVFTLSRAGKHFSCTLSEEDFKKSIADVIDDLTEKAEIHFRRP